MIERAAAGAGLDLKAHPHLLRHACANRYRRRADARYCTNACRHEAYRERR